MALLGDRVQESTTTVGTGTFALNGAVTGYVTFNSTFANGNIVWYVADDGAGNWEIGTGTVGTGTLTRTVFQSSNANALVPFAAGAKRIFCTAPYTYLLPDQTGNTGKILSTDGSIPSWITAPTGTVTSVSVASANGFAGTSSGGATPALTLSTTVTGVLKGNGTAISAAVAGTDYAAANATFTLGSTSVALGGTTSTVAGLTLTNPTINGFTGNTSVVNIGSGQFYKDASGNVGIGTSSPLNISGYQTLTLNGTTGGLLTLYSNGVRNATFYTDGTQSIIGTNNSTPLAFLTNGAERMRLDSSGNLGLGVTPSGWNSSWKAFQFGSVGAAFSNSSNAIWSGNEYLNSGGTPTYITSQYALRYRQDVGSGYHAWYTAPSGTAGNAISFTQAMTLDASGKLMVGTTTTAPGRLRVDGTAFGASSAIRVDSNFNQYGIDISGAGGLRSDGSYMVLSTVSGIIYVTATSQGVYLASGGTSWTANSDERLKTDLVPITNALDKVLKLRTVTGRYKTDEEGVSRSFFIAQDFQGNFEEALEDSDPEKLGVQYSDTTPLLAAAINELSAELNELKAKVK